MLCPVLLFKSYRYRLPVNNDAPSLVLSSTFKFSFITRLLRKCLRDRVSATFSSIDHSLQVMKADKF